uniref:Uncharacterized protein n=1 Tax=Heterorhabditis bacteriophora TaxID=37862 RepID=A0A1I7WFK7_HETBA
MMIKAAGVIDNENSSSVRENIFITVNKEIQLIEGKVFLYELVTEDIIWATRGGQLVVLMEQLRKFKLLYVWNVLNL